MSALTSLTARRALRCVSATTSGLTTETHSFLSVGLSFVHATAPNEAPSDVNTIAVYPPYFGKLKNTSLGLGSTHADIKAYFDSKYGEKSQTSGTTTVYYYEVKTETVFLTKFAICLGFLYNSNDQAASILVGYPIQK